MLLLLSCEPQAIRNPIQTAPIDRLGDLIHDQVIYESTIISHEGDDNDWYENIPRARRKVFVNGILDAVKSGRLKAYRHPVGLPVKSAEFELSVKQVNALLMDTIAQVIVDPETGEENEKTVVREITYDDIMRLTFVEEWYFDEPSLQMSKRVNGIALAYPFLNEYGEFIGYRRLFWVWLNDVKLSVSRCNLELAHLAVLAFARSAR